MARIRVALIGLSAKAKTNWADKAHLPYLLSARGSSSYELVALLNSSTASAAEARKHYGLPESVRLYGDPEALAADPNIDLVVCNTRSDVHFPTTQPSLAAGKRVFVEWPLTESIEKSEELVAGIETQRSIIGLQCRVSPVIRKVKDLIDGGAIGAILSSNIQAHTTILPRDSLPDSLAYFADRKVGGNPMTIAYGHMIDYVHDVLGEFESFQSRMQIQRPNLDINSENGHKGSVVSDVPDLLTVHGQLKQGTRAIAKGATLVATLRLGTAFPGSPGMVWTINGEKGEVQITSPAGPYIQPIVEDAPIFIKLHDYATDKVSEVRWDWDEWEKDLPIVARNVADVYERYAAWVEKGENGNANELPEAEAFPTLDSAMVRTREIHEVFAQYDRQA